MKKVFFTFYFIICSLTVMLGQYMADGIIGEWDTTPIQSEPGVFPYFRFAEQEGIFYWVAYAAQGRVFDPNAFNWLDIWFDSDFSSATGMKGDPWPGCGIDYLIQGTSVYYYTGTPGSPEWKWTMLWQYYIPRKISSDNTALEYCMDKTLFTTTPLSTTFGISFNLWYDGTEMHNLPDLDPGFIADAKNIYKIKTRTTLDLSSSTTFDCKNAYYNPYMNNPDVDNYLNFQNGLDYTVNSRHWASWGLNLLTPGSYKVKMSYQSTSQGQVTISIVNMKTNTVVKTLPALNYAANATMSEIELGTINLADVAAGYYMLVLRNSETDSHLKVQNLALTNVATHLNETELQKDVIINVDNKQLTIESKSNTKISFSFYTISGALISQMDNINSAKLILDKGAYILRVKNSGNKFSKKIIVL